MVVKKKRGWGGLSFMTQEKEKDSFIFIFTQTTVLGFGSRRPAEAPWLKLCVNAALKAHSVTLEQTRGHVRAWR